MTSKNDINSSSAAYVETSRETARGGHLYVYPIHSNDGCFDRGALNIPRTADSSKEDFSRGLQGYLSEKPTCRATRCFTARRLLEVYVLWASSALILAMHTYTYVHTLCRRPPAWEWAPRRARCHPRGPPCPAPPPACATRCGRRGRPPPLPCSLAAPARLENSRSVFPRSWHTFRPTVKRRLILYCFRDCCTHRGVLGKDMCVLLLLLLSS